ncbi:MAG: hypothetical protein LBF94_01845 [Puniceicoccales bacterium]|jgi:hypothetical protein|nr:hypothetical protein [Puniceicoccales bacterium]
MLSLLETVVLSKKQVFVRNSLCRGSGENFHLALPCASFNMKESFFAYDAEYQRLRTFGTH